MLFSSPGRRQVDRIFLSDLGHFFVRESAREEFSQLLLPRLPHHRSIGHQALLQPLELPDFPTQRQQRDQPLDLVAAVGLKDPIRVKVIFSLRPFAARQLEELLPRINKPLAF